AFVAQSNRRVGDDCTGIVGDPTTYATTIRLRYKKNRKNSGQSEQQSDFQQLFQGSSSKNTHLLAWIGGRFEIDKWSVQLRSESMDGWNNNCQCRGLKSPRSKGPDRRAQRGPQ